MCYLQNHGIKCNLWPGPHCIAKRHFKANDMNFGLFKLIHLIPKWRPINYSFVCMLISPVCLIFTPEFFCVLYMSTRQRGPLTFKQKNDLLAAILEKGVLDTYKFNVVFWVKGKDNELNPSMTTSLGIDSKTHFCRWKRNIRDL